MNSYCDKNHTLNKEDKSYFKCNIFGFLLIQFT